LKSSLNILICPLEWGLGHAARMIPVARQLKAMGHNVIIGSGEEHLALFRSELPDLTYIDFTGFKPHYSRFFPQYITLFLKTPLLIYCTISEHFRLKKIIRRYAIDIIISDNRFGLWNKNITSVYVTHMPRIPMPKPFRFMEIIGILFHRAVIKRYTLCFIPDLPGDLNLTGRLSHGVILPENVRFVGILSRFTGDKGLKPANMQEFRHSTVILSGPEPQRGILKQLLMNLLKDQEPPTVILEGRPDLKKDPSRSGNIICYNHLCAVDMAELIKRSDFIISRSGYTTIMELISLKCSAMLIPTPGQTEQEYLAEYLSEKGWFSSISQGKLKETFRLTGNSAKWSEEIEIQSCILLKNALEELLEKHHKKNQSKESGKKTKPDLLRIM